MNFFGQPLPRIKVFKMDLRLDTEHLQQGFTRAFSCVPGACWTWQSWECWQRRCPLVWTLPAAPAVLWSWPQPMAQQESSRIPSRNLAETPMVCPLSANRERSRSSPWERSLTAQSLRAVFGSHHPTLMAQKFCQPP